MGIAQHGGNREWNAKVFEPGNISTEAVEFSPSFSSSGSEIYFAKSNDMWGKGAIKSSIYYSTKKDNKWSTPKLVSFSGTYDDSDPHLTRDGKTMYFVSDRPSEASRMSADIWMVKKDKGGKWGIPTRLKHPINSPGTEYSPRTDNKGNLYFASDRSDGYGQGDLYMAKREKGKFASPVNLGNSINTAKGEWNLEVNGSGDLIIFEASERVQNLSSYGDLYISFKRHNRWTVPQHIKEINTTGSDLYPHLTDGERMLYFTSSDRLKSTDTTIYFIAFTPLYDRYKKTAVLPGK
ncbi:MAG: hypothetical protein AAF934_01200 [Bacteroidota bacterium]